MQVQYATVVWCTRHRNNKQAGYESENLHKEDALRLQLKTHAMPAVIQEVLQPKELHPT